MAALADTVLTDRAKKRLARAGIHSYSIVREDHAWGRKYWVYFFYAKGGFFSFDVHDVVLKSRRVVD